MKMSLHKSIAALILAVLAYPCLMLSLIWLLDRLGLCYLLMEVR